MQTISAELSRRGIPTLPIAAIHLGDSEVAGFDIATDTLLHAFSTGPCPIERGESTSPPVQLRHCYVNIESGSDPTPTISEEV